MARVNRKVWKCVSFSLCDIQLTRWHIDAELKRTRTLTYKWTLKVIPLILLNVVWAHASRKGWVGTGGKGLSGVWERGTLEKECPAAVSCELACVVVFCARKPRRSPHPPPWSASSDCFWSDTPSEEITRYRHGRVTLVAEAVVAVIFEQHSPFWPIWP